MAEPYDVGRGWGVSMPVNMSAERWRQLDTAFHTAVALPVEEREAFIAREMAGDEELAGELRAMLAHDGGAAGKIAGAVGAAAQGAAAQYDWIGRTVGPYRIVREIGRGGMGIVFEAVRAHAEFPKPVALKVTPEWRDAGDLRGRFQNECRFLAALDHPNIARFLDGGSEGGVPYLAMEFVEGRPAGAWLREQERGLRERIELFRKVCAAVEYAHENMIVHRDLKPGNILVDKMGEPKLLDFGIAKLLGPLDGGETATMGPRVWTPDYASPEQVRGGAITARTDVYSLGLILYELLTGERAQTADTTSAVTLEHSICEREPPPAGSLDRRLKGDLETIIAMAMRKEPARRYSSAAALSEDLGRYLSGRPVAARPSTVRYRVGKFVRRHRAGVAAGVLVAASIAGGVAATVYEARRAERRFQQVRGLANAFVFDVHDRIQSLPGSTEARKAIVATGLRYLENLRQEAGSDVALRIELAAAYQKIGDVQGMPAQSNLGDTTGALASYRSAEDLLAPLEARGDPRAKAPMASVLQHTGLVKTYRGEGASAMKVFERARKMIGDPQGKEALRLAADIDGAIVRTAQDMRSPTRGLPAAEEAMALAKRVVAIDPASEESREYLSQAEGTLGTAYRAAGDLESAARVFGEAVELREQLVRERPGNAVYRRDLLIGYGHIGDMLGLPRSGGLGDLPRAEAALRKAAEIAAWLRQSDPADRTARYDLANAKYRLGTILLARDGGAEAALREFDEARELLAGLMKGDAANLRYLFVDLYVARKQGEALEALGRDAEAARRFQEVRSGALRFRGAHQEKEIRNGVIAVMAELAKIKARAGDRAAIALADEVAAYIANEPLSPGTAWGRATIAAEMAAVYRKFGLQRQATENLEWSAKTWREMKVPKALEAQRVKELAAVEAARAN